MPNGNLSNLNIVNYSIKDTRRVDWTFGVGYEEDTQNIKRVLKDVINSHHLVLKDSEPFVRMSNHGDSTISFKLRAWAKAEDHWDLYYDILEEVKDRFD